MTQTTQLTQPAAKLTTCETGRSFLKDPQFQADLQRLRQTDNHTNLYYIARTWLLIAAAVAASIWFLWWRVEAGLHWSFDLLLLVVTIPVVGAYQHQLAALGHEGSHFSLFRNRIFNEVMADLFCFFPLFGSTQVYRLQHLAHHKWVNDPDRDPDLQQLARSGHRFEFPKSRREVLALLANQLWPINQMRYALGRLRHLDSEETSARHSGELRQSRIVPVLFLGSLATILAVFGIVSFLGDPMLRIAAPSAFAVCSLTALALLPESRYGPRIARSPLPMRLFAVLRVGVFYVQFSVVFAMGWILGPRNAVCLTLLWIVPLLTSFSLYNMLRQTLHHANADRGWLSNSRNFFVGPVLRSAVFPFGQDMHLIHHLFCSVPHFNLAEVHERLLTYPEYRDQAVRAQGWGVFGTGDGSDPTVIEVLGSDYTPTALAEPYIDYSVDRA